MFGPPNHLHVAVFADICIDGYIAACRALGIIGKLVTCPLWRELACPNTSISKMSGTYQALCASFAKLEAIPSSLLDGSAKLSPGVTLNVHAVHHELFTSSDTDGTTLVILQLIIAGCSRYSKKLLAEHLAGGKFKNLTNKQRTVTASVQPTNVASDQHLPRWTE